MVTGATDGCQITPSPSFPATLTTSSGPAVTQGPLAEGALTPTSPETGTAAVGKPVQGGQQLPGHTSPSLSPEILLSYLPNQPRFLVWQRYHSPSLILHLNSYGLEFGLLLCWPSFVWVHLSDGGDAVKLQVRASVSGLLCTSTNLDPYGEALAEGVPLRLAVRRDVRHGRGGGGGSDGDGAVGDMLAGRPMHLSVGRLNGCREGFHAVDAFSGIGQARLGADACPRARAPIHVSILRRLGAALGRDGDEWFGRGGPRWDRGRRLFVGGDA